MPTQNAGSAVQPAKDERSMEEVKEHMGEVLDRIRSKVDEINLAIIEPLNNAPSLLTNLIELDQRASTDGSNNAAVEIRSSAESASPPSVKHDELASYKSRILAVTRATEAKARESEEKFTHLKTQLEAETDLRMASEKRLQEIEIFFNRQQSTLEYEEIKRASLEEMLDEAQNSLALEVDARRAAEKARDEAIMLSGSAAETLKTLEEKRAAAESEATTALELSVAMESRAIHAEAGARKHLLEAQAAENTLREIENMVYESERIAAEAQEKCQQLESRLAQETEMRQFAEQQLKALVDELNIDLEVDWGKIEADLTRANGPVQRGNIPANEATDHFRSQIEAERKARSEAERLRAEAEKLLAETQNTLAQLEEKRLNAEAYYKNLLEQKSREHEKAISTLAGQSIEALKIGEPDFKPAPGVADEPAIFQSSLENSLARRDNRVKVLAYGSATVVLFITIILLSIAAYNQL